MTASIIIEHIVTADMDDGQPLPPYIEDNIVWHIVHRLPNAQTLWRRIFLQTEVHVEGRS
jgi:hypothetical protein